MDDEQDFDDLVTIRDGEEEDDDDFYGSDDDELEEEGVEGDEGDEEEDGEEGEEEDKAAAGPKDGDKDVLSVKDLSETQEVEISVDGELQRVPLRELANGYIREQVFHRRLNQLHEDKRQWEARVERASTDAKQVREATMQLLRNPEALDRYMEQQLPDVWQQAVRLAVQRAVDLESKTPQERLEYIRQRDRRLYEAQLQRERAERQRLQQTQQHQEDTKAAIEALRPHYRAVMAERGNPDMSSAEGQQWWSELIVALDVEAGVRGRALKPREIESTMRRLADQYLPRAEAPKPAAKPAPPKRGKSRKRRPSEEDITDPDVLFGF